MGISKCEESHQAKHVLKRHVKDDWLQVHTLETLPENKHPLIQQDNPKIVKENETKENSETYYSFPRVEVYFVSFYLFFYLVLLKLKIHDNQMRDRMILVI